ncbi:hypothetical protein ACFY4K_16145, partial [Streptomyces leeuwenhoekii]|uniref:hypothetical protein n=1 Tax=Streptomyces leeuwenhoekii TaxID=1437453 RepID=UPI0036AA5D63
AVTDAEKKVIEFSFPASVSMFIDHARRLSVSRPSHFPDPLVGGAVRQDRLWHTTSPLHSGQRL